MCVNLWWIIKKKIKINQLANERHDNISKQSRDRKTERQRERERESDIERIRNCICIKAEQKYRKKEG